VSGAFIESPGEDARVVLSARFLRDALSGWTDPTVRVAIHDRTAPLVLTGGRRIALLMPIQDVEEVLLAERPWDPTRRIVPPHEPEVVTEEVRVPDATAVNEVFTGAVFPIEFPVRTVLRGPDGPWEVVAVDMAFKVKTPAGLKWFGAKRLRTLQIGETHG
jgi:hypothetical protein